MEEINKNSKDITIQINPEVYYRLVYLGILNYEENDVRSHNIGESDYSKHLIQPWSIWREYNLDGWDADIIKRTLREKNGEDPIMDYEKIKHVCDEKIRQLNVVKHYNKLINLNNINDNIE